MYVTAIVLAAGRGLRFKEKKSKLLFEINKRPIFIYSLDILSRHPYIKEIILAVNAKNKNKIKEKIFEYKIKKIKALIFGGERRQDSVKNALKFIDEKTDLILIHDASRPFISKKLVSQVIKTAKRYKTAILAVPVKATIKKIKKSKSLFIEKTLKREFLWEAQTPQVFKKDLILEAYKRFGNLEFTDDASLVEKLGHAVKVVIGSYFNIKITTPEDLIIAKAIAKKF